MVQVLTDCEDMLGLFNNKRIVWFSKHLHLHRLETSPWHYPVKLAITIPFSQMRKERLSNIKWYAQGSINEKQSQKDNIGHWPLSSMLYVVVYYIPLALSIHQDCKAYGACLACITQHTAHKAAP